MNVYDMKSDGRDDATWAVFGFTNGRTVPLDWREEDSFFDAHPRIAIERDLEYRSKKAKLPDYSDFMSHSIFSERARTVFAPKLEGLGRWIELDFDEAAYSLFFLTNVVDALDESESEVLRFADSEKVMRIAKYAFRPDVVRDQFLFTLPQRVRSNRLVTDDFVDLVRQHKLTGFSFLPLWSSETGPAQLAGIPDYKKPYFTGLEAR
jgi:hypothetical protein